MQPAHMVAIVDGRLCDTAEAELLAHDNGWEEHTLEQPGQCRFLYRTADGEYFVQRCTAWQVERDRIELLGLSEAAELYRQLSVQVVSFQQAFPRTQPLAAPI